MMLRKITKISKPANAKIIIRDMEAAPKSMHFKRGTCEEECLFTVHTKISVTSLRQATSFPCGVRDSEYTQSLRCSNRRSSRTNVEKKKGTNYVSRAGMQKGRETFLYKVNNVRRKGENLCWQQLVSYKHSLHVPPVCDITTSTISSSALSSFRLTIFSSSWASKEGCVWTLR